MPDTRYRFIGDDDLTPVLARQAAAAAAADRAMDGLGDAATAAGRKMTVAEGQVDDLADELDRAGREADDLADDLDGVARAGGQLAAQIEATKKRIRELGDEFDRTGDKELLGQIGDERGLLGKLTRIADELADVGAKGGKEFSKGFMDALGALPAQLKGAVLVAATALGIALSPLIGAAISAAVVGGVGAGGLIGGIALAARDPAVREAASVFAGQVGAAFAPIGDQFSGPVIRALDILADAGERFARQLNLGPILEQVTPLALGLSDLATNVMPGLNKALKTGGQIFSHLAREAPELGDAISDMLAVMADEDAVLAFIYALELFEMGVRATGAAVGWLSDRFADMVQAMAALTGAMEDVPILGDVWQIDDQNDHLEEMLQKLRMSRGVMQDAGGGMSDMAKEADALARGLEEVNDAWRDWVGNLLGVDQARLGFEKALADMSEAIKESGRSLDIHSEKGRRVVDALLGGVEAALRYRDAQLEANVAPEAANRIYDENIKRLVELAVKMGIARKDAESFFGVYRNAPPLVVTFTTPGLDAAIAKASTLARILDRVDDGASARILSRQGRLVGYAEGGEVGRGLPAGAPVPILAHAGEWVLSNDETGGTGAPKLNGGGGGDIVIHLTVVTPDGEAIVRQQQRYAAGTGVRSLEALFGIPATA